MGQNLLHKIKVSFYDEETVSFASRNLYYTLFFLVFQEKRKEKQKNLIL